MIHVKRKLASWEVLEALSELFLLRGVPRFIWSDNGRSSWPSMSEPGATVGAKTACINPSSPWENSYVENLDAKIRDEVLNREIFTSLREAQILIEVWCRH